MKRSTFARPQPPRRAREPDEFASHRPAGREVAPSSGVVSAALALLEAPAPERIVYDTGAAGGRYMGRVAALGCLICRRLGYGFVAAEVHHIRHGQGGAERASDFLTLPLCREHHRGDSGFHGLGPRPFERRYGIDELGLLAETIAEIARP